MPTFEELARQKGIELVPKKQPSFKDQISKKPSFEDIASKAGIQLQRLEPKPIEKPSFLSRAKESGRGFLSGLGGKLVERVGRAEEAGEAFDREKQGLLRTTGQVTGQVAGVVGDVFEETIRGIFNLLPEERQTKIKEGTESLIGSFIDANIQVKEEVQRSEPKFAGQVSRQIDNLKIIKEEIENDPKKKRDFEAILGLTETVGLGLGKRTIETAGKTIKEAVGDVTKSGIDKVKTTIKKADDVIDTTPIPQVDTVVEPITKAVEPSGAGQVVSEIAERVPRAVERVKEKFTQAKARAERIKASPEKVQKAIKSNLDERIIDAVQTADEPTVKAYKEIVDIADSGKGKLGLKKRPEIVAGNVVADQYKLIDSQRKNIGKQLGEEVKKLFTTEKFSIKDSITKLDNILAEQGIKTSKGSKLDFKASNLTKAERTKAQELYNLATELKQLTPFQIYKKDQLFSKLMREARFGGIGSILIDTTDGQQNLFKVFRDVFNSKLDDFSPEIKRLNKEYGEVRRLVNDIDKSLVKTGKFETTGGIDLAQIAQTRLRRLLSDAQSAADFREIAELMDKSARELGFTGAKAEDLITFATEMRKLFPDTIPATGFTGGIKTGLKDVGKAVLEAGTPNLSDQQKALKELLSSLIK